MRALRYLAVAGVLLLGAALAGAWFLPGLLDWNRYRDTLAAVAATQLGRAVHIEGDVGLQLLPEPTLTAARISIGGNEDDITLSAGELRLRVALGPMLAGRLEARELSLRRAELRLPWPLGHAAYHLRPPRGLEAHIEDSRLVVGEVAFTSVDAIIASNPDTGTLSARGTARYAELPWRFTGGLSALRADGSAGLQVTLDGRDAVSDTGASFAGRLAADGRLTGTLAARGADLSRLVPAPPVAWRARGQLAAQGGLAAADDLALEIDGSPARGSVALRVGAQPRLDLALDASRLDLNAWLPVLLRPRQFRMPLGLGLSADAAALAGGTLRRLRADFDLAADGLGLREVSAVLPGDASARLSGRVLSVGGQLRLLGQGSLGAPDLRTTLRWLAPLAPALAGALPPEVARTASFAARITAGPGRLALDELQGTFDGARLGGRLAIGLDGPPRVEADLALDRLALDPWLPDQPPHFAGLPRRFAGFGAAIRLRARAASLGDVPINDLVLEAEAGAAAITVRRLEGSVEGIHVAASGAVGGDGRLTGARLALATADASPLATLLPAEWRATPALWRAPASLTIEAEGPEDALALRAGLDLGDAHLDAQPTLDLVAGSATGPLALRHPGAPRFLTMLGLPDARRWTGDGSLSLVGDVTGSERRQAIGPFELTTGDVRSTGELVLDRHGHEPTLSGHLDVDTGVLPVPDPRADDPLPLWMLRGWRAALHVTAAHLRGGGRSLADDVAVDLALDDGRLRLDGLTGRMLDGTLAGSAALDAAAIPPRLSLRAELAGLALPGQALGTTPDVSGGHLEGRLALDAAGYSPAALLATLTGTATATVQGGAADGFDLGGAVAALQNADPGVGQDRLRAALAGGSTGFARLDVAASVARGVVTLDGTRLSADAGSAELAGTLDLPEGTMDAQLTLHPALAHAPDLTLRLGAAAVPRHGSELAAAARWFADRQAPP